MKRTLISLISIAILLVPVNANAHAGVVSTFPVQDQIFDVMPLDIRATFSEELLTLSDQDVNSLMLTHFDGPAIELTNLTVDGNVISATIPTADYEAGVYEVTYRVVSADGHKVSDSFTFSVNAPVVTSSPYLPEKNDGVLPLPIVGAIALVTILGGFFALRARSRKS
ncbi:CopC domain containing protein [Candidatus Nanopelagicaceae bacterium]